MTLLFLVLTACAAPTGQNTTAAAITSAQTTLAQSTQTTRSKQRDTGSSASSKESASSAAAGGKAAATNETGGRQTTAGQSSKKNTSAPKSTAKKTTARQTARQQTAKKETSKTKTTKAAARTCSITVECRVILSHMSDLKAGHEAYVPSNGYIISKESRTFKQGDSVYDVLKAACAAHGVKLTAVHSSFGIYVKGIGNIDEMDCGKNSGWMYKVNGSPPGYTCENYTVSSGDDIVFYYVV